MAMSLERAKQLHRKSSASGFLPTIEIKEITEATPEERAEINAVWDTMSGNAAYVHALGKLVRQLEV